MEIKVDGNVIITEIENADGTTRTHVTTFDALASWRELLGTKSDEETLLMMLSANDPGIVNEETRETAWTAAYLGLEQSLTGGDASDETLMDSRNESRGLLGLPQLAGPQLASRLMRSAFIQPDIEGLDMSVVEDALSTGEVRNAISEARTSFLASLAPKESK
jgi:hypothetical protein